MAGWRETLKTESGFQFQGTLYLRRTYSNPGITPYPYWECELSEELPQQPSFGLPEGPFLHHGSGVFAPDLPTLAANWLAAARWRQQTTLSHRYRLLIEDRRARIAGFDAQDNDLLVTTEAITKEPLYCSANATSYAGAVQQDTHLVQAGRAAFHFDFAVQELEIWLTLDDGYPLDNYRESPHAASWGRERSIYARPRAPNELAASSLAAALAAGEGQITEFKPFVRLRPRDSKVAEILETVSAFANAGGGALYLGVNDYGEPLGMARELRRDYGSKCRDDVQCLQDAYVHDMKRLLNEGLTPPVLPEFKWHEMALESVLEVRIPSSDILVSLITSGGVFRRVNATNQKLRPIDALQSPPN